MAGIVKLRLFSFWQLIHQLSKKLILLICNLFWILSFTCHFWNSKILDFWSRLSSRNISFLSLTLIWFCWIDLMYFIHNRYIWYFINVLLLLDSHSLFLSSLSRRFNIKLVCLNCLWSVSITEVQSSLNTIHVFFNKIYLFLCLFLLLIKLIEKFPH